MISAIKEQALEVMNKELSKKHGQGEDMIHNMICDMDDDELFEAIVKPGKSIGDALQYVASKAKEFENNGVAGVNDDFVINYAIEYFKSNKTAVPVVASVGSSKSSKPIEQRREVKQEPLVMDSVQQAMDLIKSNKSKTKKQSNKVEDELMSIFDFGVNVEEQLEAVEEDGDDDDRDEEYSD